MSVVLRSAYRQMLRVGAKLSKHYPDPNDLCFALFGVLVGRTDFAAAGYGNSFTSVVKHAFQRPSVTGVSQDTPQARIASSFGFLRRLHELEETSKSVQPRLRRRVRLETGASAEQDEAVATGDAMTGTSRTTAKDTDSEAATAAAPTVAATSDSIITGEAVFFIERFQNSKLQKFSRHVVMGKDQDSFPAYPHLLPPEPVYPRSMRVDMPFPFMVDAVLCLSAAAQQYTVGAATTPQDSALHAQGADRSGVVRTRSTEFAKPLSPLTTPTNAEEWMARLANIPTRTIAVTDFMEVELCTQFVCSSASQTTSRSAETAVSGESLPKGAAAKDMNLFLYYMFIRNRGPRLNPKKWHAQIMSQHLVILDVMRSGVVELARPGAMGNFPQLDPGSSHTFQSGASLMGTEGIIRGTIQVNVFNEDGEMRCIDIRVAPTRLSVHAKESPFESHSEKKRAARRRRSAAVERRSDK